MKDLENCSNSALLEAKKLKEDLETNKNNLNYIKDKYDDSMIQINKLSENNKQLDQSKFDLSLKNCELKCNIEKNENDIERLHEDINKFNNSIKILEVNKNELIESINEKDKVAN